MKLFCAYFSKCMNLLLYRKRRNIYNSTIEDKQADEFKLLSPLCWLCVSEHDISIITITIVVVVDVICAYIDK